MLSGFHIVSADCRLNIESARPDMALRPSLTTRGLAAATQPSDTGSPAESRGDAKKNMLKAMRPLPTQHYWNVYFDR